MFWQDAFWQSSFWADGFWEGMGQQVLIPNRVIQSQDIIAAMDSANTPTEQASITPSDTMTITGIESILVDDDTSIIIVDNQTNTIN